MMHKQKKKFAAIRNSIYPKTKKDFLRDLGQEFTIIDFAKRYNLSYGGAINRVINYKIKNFIALKGRVKNKNIYKVLDSASSL